MTSTQTDVLAGLSTSLALKAPVFAAILGPVTLSGVGNFNTYDAGVIDIPAGKRVLVPDHVNPIFNGIYDTNTGLWTRSPDFDGARDAIRGTRVFTQADTLWELDTDDPVIGVTPLVFAQTSLSPPGLDISSSMPNLSELANIDFFNSPTSMKNFAAALKTGVVKVVFVGDSALYGWKAGAQASPIAIMQRRLKRVFHSVAFTFIDRAIPGGTFANFLNAAFTPSQSAQIGAASAVGASGRDRWNVNTQEEVSYRWPEGAATFNATSWKQVVINDAPDLLVVALGTNDISVGDSITDQKVNLLALATYVAALAKQPSVVLVTETTSYAGSAYPPDAARPQLRGYGQMLRSFARFKDWGLWDAGRVFERYSRGVDPLRFKMDIDRYLYGITAANNDLWQVDALGAVASAFPVSSAGTAAVQFDSSGKHAAAAQVNFVRKVECAAFGCHFNIRKLATDDDVVTVCFGNPLTGNTLSDARRMVLKFFNAAGVGKVQLFTDGASVGVSNVAAFPTGDAADYWVTVLYDATDIYIFLNGNTDPTAYDVAYGIVSHQPTWPSIGYENLVGAPAVKVKGIVMQTGVFSPTSDPATTIPLLFGATNDYLTANRSLGGDVQTHFSSFGYHVVYGDSLMPVLQATREAYANDFDSGTYDPVFSLTTNLTSADASLYSPWQWVRVGNMVRVSGSVNLQATAGAPTNTVLGIRLPIASNFANAGEATGVGVAASLTAANGNVGSVFADTANDRASFRWQAVATTVVGWGISFSYEVK